jgi:hypothetical protein
VLRRRSKSAKARQSNDESARMKENVQRSFGPPVDDQAVRDEIADLKKQRDIGMLTDLEYALKLAAKLAGTDRTDQTIRRARWR